MGHWVDGQPGEFGAVTWIEGLEGDSCHPPHFCLPRVEVVPEDRTSLYVTKRQITFYYNTHV